MASLYVWSTRCVPAFSICLVAVLLVLSFVVSPYGRGHNGQHTGRATTSQLILSIYTAFLHLLSIAFPIRVCWSMRDYLRRMRAAAHDSLSPDTNGSTGQKEKPEGATDDPVPLFIIILPAYKEEVATLEETLRVLASHSQARTSYHLYLAMEEKEEKSAFKAAQLCDTFRRSFLRMSYTVHPANIPGEAQGKSSNESWAAKQALKHYTDVDVKRNAIFTTMDADTHLSSRYFSQIAKLHVQCADNNQQTIYVPPLVFDRNLHHVPLFVRTADLMWAGAGLSSLYRGSNICIPTSVYSLPVSLVEQVGGWDTGPGAIGEDMHMYLKCFFATSGNLKVQIVYAPASQCNVSSERKGLVGWLLGLEARYKQALRHMWGSLDTGFAIRETVKMIQRQGQAGRRISRSSSNGYRSDYTGAGSPKSLTRMLESSRVAPQAVHWHNLYTLSHRLFEAHFLPIHLAVILITSSIYSALHPSFLVPTVLKLALDFSGICRLIGFSSMLCFFYLYERYHRLCVGLRMEEMRQAGMLDHMEEHDGFTPHVFQVAGLFEVALFPIGGIIFGALPALHAVLSHLFTDRLTYVVSLKPQLALKPWRDMSRMTP